MTIRRILFRSTVRLMERFILVQKPTSKTVENLSLGRLPDGNRHTDIITIAFNNSRIIPLHTRLLAANFGGEHTHIVADNSTDPIASREIRDYCRREGIAYVRLPKNRLGKTAGPSYSHAAALNYCYRNIIRRRQPCYFGITDHDLFLLKPVQLAPILDRQNVYGPQRRRDDYWYLSGIMSFFKFAYTCGRKVDFMPVTYNGTYLDSGGGNWKVLYRGLDTTGMAFCAERMDHIAEGDDRHQDMVEIFDERWLHTINGSYWKKVAIEKENILDQLIEKYTAELNA